MRQFIVTHDVDLANLPPLTERQKDELAVLSARPDGQVDYSDIPALTETFWEKAARGKFLKPPNI